MRMLVAQVLHGLEPAENIASPSGGAMSGADVAGMVMSVESSAAARMLVRT